METEHVVSEELSTKCTAWSGSVTCRWRKASDGVHGDVGPRGCRLAPSTQQAGKDEVPRIPGQGWPPKPPLKVDDGVNYLVLHPGVGLHLLCHFWSQMGSQVTTSAVQAGGRMGSASSGVQKLKTTVIGCLASCSGQQVLLKLNHVKKEAHLAWFLRLVQTINGSSKPSSQCLHSSDAGSPTSWTAAGRQEGKRHRDAFYYQTADTEWLPPRVTSTDLHHELLGSVGLDEHGCWWECLRDSRS